MPSCFKGNLLTIAMEQTYVVVTAGNTLFTVTTDISHRIL